MGDTGWDDATYTGTVGSAWLRANFDIDNGPYGYWTLSRDSDYFDYAWYVSYRGYLHNLGVGRDNYNGVRPVITIDTSKIKNWDFN